MPQRFKESLLCIYFILCTVTCSTGVEQTDREVEKTQRITEANFCFTYTRKSHKSIYVFLANICWDATLDHAQCPCATVALFF